MTHRIHSDHTVLIHRTESNWARVKYVQLVDGRLQVNLCHGCHIRQRDHLDQTRAISPLRKADDAIVLDNGGMTLEEEIEWFDKVFASIV